MQFTQEPQNVVQHDGHLTKGKRETHDNISLPIIIMIKRYFPRIKLAKWKVANSASWDKAMTFQRPVLSMVKCMETEGVLKMRDCSFPVCLPWTESRRARYHSTACPLAPLWKLPLQTPKSAYYPYQASKCSAGLLTVYDSSVFLAGHQGAHQVLKFGQMWKSHRGYHTRLMDFLS